MKITSGGVCAAKGFKASGVHCGIRKNRTKRDLALIYSEKSPTRRLSIQLTSSRARRWSSRKSYRRRQGAGGHMQQRKREHLQRERR